MCFFVPNLADEQDVSISALENVMGLVVFFSTTLLQWFVISLVGLGLYRHLFKRKYETIIAA